VTKALGIDHLAIAVEDLDVSTRLWSEQFGLRVGEREVVDEQGVEVQMLYAGETRVELVCPIRADSPIRSFLDKRGPGIHHLALAVESCQQSIDHVSAQGGEMIHPEPRVGAHQTRIAFVHPRSSGGVLTELVEGGEGPWQQTT